MMLYMLNDNNLWFVLLGISIVLFIGFVLFKKIKGETYETIVEEMPDEALECILEYRTYMVNQWICLLAFWLDINAKDAQTKVLSPAPNQTSIYFFYKNIEVYAFFNWEENFMQVKTSVLNDENGYTTYDKVFSIANGSLPTNKLLKFITKAKNIHDVYYELSADDVIAITKQLKIMPKDENEEVVQMRYFDIMADMMILMRKRKNRRNKKLLAVYVGLVDFLWQKYDKEFLKYLNMSEEEFLNIQQPNSEKTEDNE